MISIVYFSLNVLLLFAVAFIVYRHGNYDKIVSKSFLKDAWSQRKIYSAILVHFYDTATDIGVLVFWHGVMQNEIDGIEDYEDIDMRVYFWAGIAALILYRIAVIIVALRARNVPYMGFDDWKWWHMILIALDLYILLAVRKSIKEAEEATQKNKSPKNPAGQKTVTSQKMLNARLLSAGNKWEFICLREQRSLCLR